MRGWVGPSRAGKPSPIRGCGDTEREKRRRLASQEAVEHAADKGRNSPLPADTQSWPQPSLLTRKPAQPCSYMQPVDDHSPREERLLQ